MAHPVLITPDMPNVKSRLHCGGGGHAAVQKLFQL
jgi:hypothetical protein